MEEQKKNCPQRAVDYSMQGYNCAQSVVMAFCERYGMSEEFAARSCAAFGGGIGKQRYTCGAVLGMAMLTGLEEGNSSPQEKEKSKRCQEVIKKLMAEFNEQMGSTICGELLGLPGYKKAEGPMLTAPLPEALRKKPCALKILFAAQLFEKHLRESGGKERS